MSGSLYRARASHAAPPRTHPARPKLNLSAAAVTTGGEVGLVQSIPVPFTMGHGIPCDGVVVTPGLGGLALQSPSPPVQPGGTPGVVGSG